MKAVISVAEYRALLARTPGVRRKHPEDELQRAVCAFWSAQWPDTWHKTFHPPNGLAAKSHTLAAIFKGLGVKSGVYDLICIARRGPYTGLALELKARRGRVSDTQHSWGERFASEGWCCAIAFNLDQAMQALHAYHEHPPPPEVLLPHDIRQLPATETRVESGPIVFGDDRPGVFVRGDSAAFFALYLRAYLTEPIDPRSFRYVLCHQVLRGLLSCLESSDLNNRTGDRE